MIGFLPWLVRWTRRAGTIDFVPPWLLQSAQYKIVFSLYYSPSHSDIGIQGTRASFFQGLLERGSSGTHFHRGPYLAIILRSFRLKSLQVPHFGGGSFVRVSFFGAFYWWIVRAQLLRRLWTGSPFQEHYRALVSEGGREA